MAGDGGGSRHVERGFHVCGGRRRLDSSGPLRRDRFGGRRARGGRDRGPRDSREVRQRPASGGSPQRLHCRDGRSGNAAGRKRRALSGPAAQSEEQTAAGVRAAERALCERGAVAGGPRHPGGRPRHAGISLRVRPRESAGLRGSRTEAVSARTSDRDGELRCAGGGEIHFAETGGAVRAAGGQPRGESGRGGGVRAGDQNGGAQGGAGLSHHHVAGIEQRVPADRGLPGHGGRRRLHDARADDQFHRDELFRIGRPSQDPRLHQQQRRDAGHDDGPAGRGRHGRAGPQLRRVGARSGDLRNEHADRFVLLGLERQLEFRRGCPLRRDDRRRRFGLGRGGRALADADGGAGDELLEPRRGLRGRHARDQQDRDGRAVGLADHVRHQPPQRRRDGRRPRGVPLDESRPYPGERFGNVAAPPVPRRHPVQLAGPGRADVRHDHLVGRRDLRRPPAKRGEHHRGVQPELDAPDVFRPRRAPGMGAGIGRLHPGQRIQLDRPDGVRLHGRLHDGRFRRPQQHHGG